MENNLENKKRFFAKYWGQEVAIQKSGGGTGFKYVPTEHTIDEDIKADVLYLRDLSSVNDDELLELGVLLGWKGEHIERALDIINGGFESASLGQMYKAVYFLLSKGFYLGDNTEIFYEWCEIDKTKK